MAGHAPVPIVERPARLEQFLPFGSSPQTALRLLRLGYAGNGLLGESTSRAIAQDEKDLQGAIVIAPEFRDLQRFLRLQGSGGRHIDLNHEVRGWVNGGMNPIFPYHHSLMLDVEAIIRLNACGHLLASKHHETRDSTAYPVRLGGP